MNITLLISKNDVASMNIKSKLLEIGKFEASGVYKNEPYYRYKNFILITIDDEFLYADEIDKKITNEIGIIPEIIIFASKHKSESSYCTLTVHPIGNFGIAELGGRSYELVSCEPVLMTQALRKLYIYAKNANLPHQVCFECTHHGPYITTRAFFIEIGSSEKDWQEPIAGEIIAKTLLELSIHEEKNPVVLGIGGGHYAPRHTDVAIQQKINYSHIVAKYNIDKLDRMLDKLISVAIPNYVYFHKKV